MRLLLVPFCTYFILFCYLSFESAFPVAYYYGVMYVVGIFIYFLSTNDHNLITVGLM